MSTWSWPALAVRLRPAAWPRAVRDGVRSAWPFAALLAFALGGSLFAGANLSTAFPSEQKPFGWPGTATFDNAVAMVRPELLLAATVPAVLWGARTLGNLDPRRDGMRGFWTRIGIDMPFLWVGVLGGALIGKWAASKTPDDALLAFTVAHGLLATAFYLIGLAVSVAFRRNGLPVAVGAWGFFAYLFEDLVRWQTFRQAGYFELRLGHFPGWFYVAQALSPVAAYRGVLIMWREGFRDGLEHAVLDDAPLPAWMNAGNFVLLMLVLWVAVPLAYASLGWWTRAHWHERSGAAPVAASPATATATGPGAGSAPATRAAAAPPPRATRRSGASTNGTAPPASGGGGAGAHSAHPGRPTRSGLPTAMEPADPAGPGRRSP